MKRSLSPLLRSGLVVLLLAPSFSSVQAAAQVVGAAAVSGTSAVSAAAGASVRAPLALGAMNLPAASAPINFSALSNMAPAFAPSAVIAAPASGLAAPAAIPMAAATPALAERSAAPAALAVPGSAASALSGVFRSDNNSAASPADVEAHLSALIEGETTRRALNTAAPVAAGLPMFSAASALGRSSPAASSAAKAVPPAASRSKSFTSSVAFKALLVAGVLILLPAAGFAATTAAPFAAAAASVSYLASIQPFISAAGALAGAVYGMFAARPKDGSSASAGEVFASILRYGALGGAGAYVLTDLTHAAFGGTIGLKPLSGAVAIAAMGRTAFQDKFTDVNTTSADRVMGAFPAAAAAVGISLAVAVTALVAPAVSFKIATTAMAATGVATAFFAAVFKPRRSPPDGPALMAKGYVLQALMMGLALAVTNPLLFWPFAALGAYGFGLVLWATAREAWSLRPGAPEQALPPAPPPKTGPTTQPTTPTTQPTTPPAPPKP